MVQGLKYKTTKKFLVRMELDLVESETVSCSIDLYSSGCNVEFYRYSTV